MCGLELHAYYAFSYLSPSYMTVFVSSVTNSFLCVLAAYIAGQGMSKFGPKVGQHFPNLFIDVIGVHIRSLL